MRTIKRNVMLVVVLALFFAASCAKKEEQPGKDEKPKTQETAKPPAPAQPGTAAAAPAQPELPPPPPPVPVMGADLSKIDSAAKSACDALNNKDFRAFVDMVYNDKQLEVEAGDMRKSIKTTIESMESELPKMDENAKNSIAELLPELKDIDAITDNRQFAAKVMGLKFEKSGLTTCEILSVSEEPECEDSQVERYKKLGIELEACGKAEFRLMEKGGNPDDEKIDAVKIQGKWYFPD